MMRKSLGFIFFFILSISAPFSIKSIPITFSSAINDSTASTTTISSRPRRILHQPLFPVTSTPPPYSDPEPPPPPPPDSSSSSSSSSLEPPPFFNEQPTGPTPDQSRPTPSLNSNGTMPIPAATPPSKPTKTVAVAISVVIVTLGMLSALAFFLYRHRSKHPAETEKLVGGGGGDSNSINNSQRFSEDPRVPPSSFLYIGTVEPSQSSVVEQSGVNATANSSPDRKLNSVKRSSDRYRPSPELQPLPPLPHPPVIDSPSEISSSEEEYEESHYTAFYTPQASSLVSYDDSFHSPASRLNNPVHSSYSVPARIDSHFNSNNNVPSVPHSKRTSPKSRLYVSTTKQTQPTPPPPPPPQATRLQPHQIQTTQSTISSSPPRRPKFSSPPPPPNLALLQSISNRSVGAPPPPPPPPPSLSIPGRVKPSDSNVSTMPRQFLSEPKFPVPTRPKADSISRSGTSNSVEAVENPNSEEKHDGEGERPRLKPLHWDKVRATSDRATVWDQLKSSSFQLNEDMMETLFCFNSANPAPKEVTRKSVLPPVEKENRVLDPKKSQNIAILLRALNVSREEVTESLLDGNPEGLGPELLETLVKMAPTKEEEIKLRDYHGDVSKLGSAERFLKAVLDIPFAFKRVEAMLYRANFDTELKYLRNCFESLEAASGELKNSRLFLALLEAVLRTGNRMNVGTNRGDAKAFKLDTLLKLVDIKGTDGKTTLLHFVVQEIIRSEGVGTNENNQIETQAKMKDDDFNKQGLQIVSGLSRDLVNVKKAAGMDSDVLSSYVSKLEIGLEKVSLILQYEKIPDGEGKFFNSMKLFLKEAEEEMTRIKADEKKALSLVKGVTEYFHGNAAKEEAHPFRIFMIVRDFLSILDQVCKEVGRMQGRTVVGSARSFRISSTASLPVLNRYNVRQARSSDEESSSSP